MWKYTVGTIVPELKGSVELAIYNHLVRMGGASWSNEIIQYIGSGKNPYLNRMVERGVICRLQVYTSTVPGRQGTPVILGSSLRGDGPSNQEYGRLLSAMSRITSNTTRTYWILREKYGIK